MNPYLDIVLRSVAVYVFMVLAIRLFGKKELSQISTTDLVFLVLISNSVQNAMVGPNTSLLGGITAATVLFILNYTLKIVMFRSKGIKNMIEGKPVILIYDGKLNVKNMHEESINMDELEEAVRQHGIESYKNVKLAILEVDGNISVIADQVRNDNPDHTKIT